MQQMPKEEESVILALQKCPSNVLKPNPIWAVQEKQERSKKK